MFAVEAFPATELGNASFLLVDQDHEVGLVIDPHRDVDGYLTRAEALGIKLTHALDTHLHNDFASGRGELAAEAGTAIGELDAGQELAFGGLTLRALHTPGHTPDHKSYLLVEGERPRALFSGGAVMIGAIARTCSALTWLSTLRSRLCARCRFVCAGCQTTLQSFRLTGAAPSAESEDAAGTRPRSATSG